MATIEKRLGNDGAVSYRARVRLKGHPAESATFERITDAKHWVQNTEAAIREGRHFKSAKSKKYTLSQLIERYTKEILDLSGRDTYNQRLYLKYWKQELGDYVLADVTPSLIAEHRNKLIGSVNRYGKKLSPISANRYLTALGHVFTIAVKQWELLEGNPVQRIQKLKEPRGRVRFLSDDERNALLKTCKESDNPYLHMIVVLALSTGARKGELLTLKWQDVSLERRLVTLHETKNGERRALPIQGYAYQLLSEHAKVRRLNSDYTKQRRDEILEAKPRISKMQIAKIIHEEAENLAEFRVMSKENRERTIYNWVLKL